MTKLIDASDEKDMAILKRRLTAWNQVTGPRVGDFCLMPDGTLRRFTHDHGDRIQTTHEKFGLGSFYFGDGWMDYSGALDPPIDKRQLEDTGEFELGAAWFFHHDERKAHNGVAVSVECRVFRVKGKMEKPRRDDMVRIAA